MKTRLHAAGDLAKKKIYPSLFALYYQGMLPQRCMIYGYARSDMTDDAFRESIMAMLPCRLTDAADCSRKMDAFMRLCALPPCHAGALCSLCACCVLGARRQVLYTRACLTAQRGLEQLLPGVQACR